MKTYKSLENTVVGFFICILLLLFVADLKAQTSAPTIVWGECYGGSLSDNAYHIHQTSDNNYLFCGDTWSDDGDVNGVYGLSDAWVMKVTNNGSILWQLTIGGTEFDRLYDAIEMDNGDYYFLGSSTSTDFDISGNHGEYDVMLAKLNANGVLQWTKLLGGTQDDFGNAMIQNEEGNIVIVGSSFSDDGDITSANGLRDVWLLEIDLQGNILWQKTYGGTSNDEGMSVTQTTDGSYIIGATTGSSDGDIGYYHGGNSDTWLIKVDSIGTISWEQTYGGSNSDMVAYVHQTDDGGYMFCTTTESNNGDVIGLHYSASVGLAYDVWLVKLDPVGNIIWNKCYGGTSMDNVTGFIPTVGGYVMSINTASNDEDVSGLNAYQDSWIVKVNNDGTLIWQKCFGGSNIEFGHSIIKNAIDNYVIAGFTRSSDGDITGHHGQEDAWVFEIDDKVSTIDDRESVKNFSVISPFSEMLRVQDLSANDKSIIVTDIVGRTILQSQLYGSNEFKLNVNALAVGSYTITVISNSKAQSVRAVKL